MLDKIMFHFPWSSRSSIYDSQEVTSLELNARTAEKVNEVVDVVNGFTTDINSREKSTDLTNNRKISVNGDFYGTLNGKTLPSVFGDIANSLDLSEQLINMINNRVSIGVVVDGGDENYPTPQNFSIDGGEE